MIRRKYATYVPPINSQIIIPVNFGEGYRITQWAYCSYLRFYRIQNRYFNLDGFPILMFRNYLFDVSIVIFRDIKTTGRKMGFTPVFSQICTKVYDAKNHNR